MALFALYRRARFKVLLISLCSSCSARDATISLLSFINISALLIMDFCINFRIFSLSSMAFLLFYQFEMENKILPFKCIYAFFIFAYFLRRIKQLEHS